MAILIVSIIFLTFAGDPRRTKVTSGHRRKDNYCASAVFSTTAIST